MRISTGIKHIAENKFIAEAPTYVCEHTQEVENEVIVRELFAKFSAETMLKVGTSVEETTDENGNIVTKSSDKFIRLDEAYDYSPRFEKHHSKVIEEHFKRMSFKHIIKTDVHPVDWIIELKQRALHLIQAQDVRRFVQWAINVNNDILHTISTGEFALPDPKKRNALNIIFRSSVQGSGKSKFISNLVQGLQDLGLEAKSDVMFPTGRFNNSREYSKNLVCGLSEYVQGDINTEVLMNVARREPYSFEQKNRDIEHLPGRSILLCSTNSSGIVHDREFQTFDVIPCSWRDAPERVFTSSIDGSYTNFLCKQLYYFSEHSEYNISYLEDNNISKFYYITSPDVNRMVRELMSLQSTVIIELIEHKAACPAAGLDVMKMSPNQIATVLELSSKQLQELSRACRVLNKKQIDGKKLLPVTQSRLDDKYIQYDFSQIFQLEPEDFDTGIYDDEDYYIQAEVEWNAIIEEFKKMFPTDDDNKPTKTEVYTSDDAQKFGMPICADAYSQPKFQAEETDQFIVAAEYTDEYKSQHPNMLRIDRQGEHMQPVCFVYESDDLPLDEQRAIIDDVLRQYKDNVFSVTYSGSKSYHILVYIDPADREEVKNDYKWYWEQVALKMFGIDYMQHLDKQCANISRLTRRPGAMRDNGKEQSCYWLNRDVKGFDIKQFADSNKRKRANEQIAQEAAEQRRVTYSNDDERDPMQILRACANKSQKPNALLALEILESGGAEAGSDMVGALGYLKYLSKSIPCIEDLHKQLWQICHTQHPSNIKGNYERYAR